MPIGEVAAVINQTRAWSEWFGKREEGGPFEFAELISKIENRTLSTIRFKCTYSCRNHHQQILGAVLKVY